MDSVIASISDFGRGRGQVCPVFPVHPMARCDSACEAQQTISQSARVWLSIDEVYAPAWPRRDGSLPIRGRRPSTPTGRKTAARSTHQGDKERHDVEGLDSARPDDAISEGLPVEHARC